MKFKYSFQWSEDGGINYSARIPITIIHPNCNNEMPIWGLIDSGASETLINPEVGKILGIDIAKGEKVVFAGIGGNIIGYRHTVKIRVIGSKYLHTIQCAFAPVDRVGVDVLLGQSGFFDFYKIVFEKYKKQFEVNANKKTTGSIRV
jgi:hypothetical protein